MKKIYLPLLLLFTTTFIFSQKETNTWIFGFSNLLDFNTDPVTINFLPNTPIFAERNTISMSDDEGNLLFYSEGFQLFNRENEVMPNGNFNGNFSATHPVFVVPKPNDINKYYLIINQSGFGGGFLEWREIDMNLDGGLGDVVPNSGGFLTNLPTNKITAVQHSNLQDIWIISHRVDSDIYEAWLATSSGINTPPVESPIGSFIDFSNFSNLNGQIKTSVDGSKIAAANEGLGNVEIFDFDRSTGQLSNPIILEDINSVYGVEFSPNGQYLYVTNVDQIDFVQKITQYDLWAGNQTNIENSAVELGGGFISFGLAGALQLASDGKIYSTNPFDITLGVISEPNSQGLSCDYNPEGIFLFGAETTLGLPSFYHAYFQVPFFTYSGLCPGSITEFSLDGFDNTIDSVEWEFGDSASGSKNFSTDLDPVHQYPGSGSYLVKLTVYSGSETFINSGQVHIAPVGINLGPDQTVCSNNLLSINAFTPNATYNWSTGSTDPSIVATSPDTYWVEVTVDTCPVLIDSVTISHLIAPDADLGGDGGLCNGEAATLEVASASPNATYSWSNGSTTSNITVFFGGTYGVTVTNPNGCSDTDEVVYQFDQVVVNPNQANLACFGDSTGVALVFPASGQLPFTYEWFDGDTLYTHNGLAAGTYTVTITDALGCTAKQEFTLSQPPELTVDFVVNSDNPNTSNADGQVLLQPDGGVPPYLFEWEAFGVTDNPLKQDLANGIYDITVTDDNECEKLLQIEVGTTSIEELEKLQTIQLFPNPASDLVFIKIPEGLNEQLEISISNTLGQRISENYLLQKGMSDFSIDVSSLSSGIYFFRMRLGEEERIWKAVIQ